MINTVQTQLWEKKFTSFFQQALSWLLIRNLRHGEMNHFDMLPFF